METKHWYINCTIYSLLLCLTSCKLAQPRFQVEHLCNVRCQSQCDTLTGPWIALASERYIRFYQLERLVTKMRCQSEDESSKWRIQDFPAGGRGGWWQALSLRQKPVTWLDICRKLHEKERNWTAGACTWRPPPIRQCFYRSLFFQRSTICKAIKPIYGARPCNRLPLAWPGCSYLGTVC